jgi:hypothetical protein
VTDPNKAHITLIVDRTGSMEAIRSDAEGAVNAFISEQKKLDKPCTLLLADFDDQEPFRIEHDGDLNSCKIYALRPRGNTPLLDAVGRGLTITGERLAALSEDQRPGQVFFVVETDGEENASKDWTRDKVVAKIKEQEETYKWTFIFLGAGKEAWVAGRMFAGTSLGANSVSYMATPASYTQAHMHTAHNVMKARAAGHDRDVQWKAEVDEEGNVKA